MKSTLIFFCLNEASTQRSYDKHSPSASAEKPTTRDWTTFNVSIKRKPKIFNRNSKKLRFRDLTAPHAYLSDIFADLCLKILSRGRPHIHIVIMLISTFDINYLQEIRSKHFTSIYTYHVLKGKSASSNIIKGNKIYHCAYGDRLIIFV